MMLTEENLEAGQRVLPLQRALSSALVDWSIYNPKPHALPLSRETWLLGIIQTHAHNIFSTFKALNCVSSSAPNRNHIPLRTIYCSSHCKQPELNLLVSFIFSIVSFLLLYKVQSCETEVWETLHSPARHLTRKQLQYPSSRGCGRREGTSKAVRQAGRGRGDRKSTLGSRKPLQLVIHLQP